MIIDATFWVGISFVLFFAGLIYLKVPQKVNEILNNLISNIKNEIDESEKLRTEAKILLDKSQIKLESAQNESKKIIDEAKKESENLIIEMNDKFHKSSEIKKNLAKNKISQMKEAALKEIKNNSIRLAVTSVKKLISTSIDKSKLDNLFEKNLQESIKKLIPIHCAYPDCYLFFKKEKIHLQMTKTTNNWEKLLKILCKKTPIPQSLNQETQMII